MIRSGLTFFFSLGLCASGLFAAFLGRRFPREGRTATSSSWPTRLVLALGTASCPSRKRSPQADSHLVLTPGPILRQSAGKDRSLLPILLAEPREAGWSSWQPDLAPLDGEWLKVAGRMGWEGRERMQRGQGGDVGVRRMKLPGVPNTCSGAPLKCLGPETLTPAGTFCIRVVCREPQTGGGSLPVGRMPPFSRLSLGHFLDNPALAR